MLPNRKIQCRHCGTKFGKNAPLESLIHHQKDCDCKSDRDILKVSGSLDFPKLSKGIFRILHQQKLLGFENRALRNVLQKYFKSQFYVKAAKTDNDFKMLMNQISCNRFQERKKTPREGKENAERSSRFHLKCKKCEKSFHAVWDAVDHRREHDTKTQPLKVLQEDATKRVVKHDSERYKVVPDSKPKEQRVELIDLTLDSDGPQEDVVLLKSSSVIECEEGYQNQEYSMNPMSTTKSKRENGSALNEILHQGQTLTEFLSGRSKIHRLSQEIESICDGGSEKSQLNYEFKKKQITIEQKNSKSQADDFIESINENENIETIQSQTSESVPKYVFSETESPWNDLFWNSTKDPLYQEAKVNSLQNQTQNSKRPKLTRRQSARKSCTIKEVDVMDVTGTLSENSECSEWPFSPPKDRRTSDDDEDNFVHFPASCGILRQSISLSDLSKVPLCRPEKRLVHRKITKEQWLAKNIKPSQVHERMLDDYSNSKRKLKATARKSTRSQKSYIRNPDNSGEVAGEATCECYLCGKIVSVMTNDLNHHWNTECSKGETR